MAYPFVNPEGGIQLPDAHYQTGKPASPAQVWEAIANARRAAASLKAHGKAEIAAKLDQRADGLEAAILRHLGDS